MNELKMGWMRMHHLSGILAKPVVVAVMVIVRVIELEAVVGADTAHCDVDGAANGEKAVEAIAEVAGELQEYS